MAAQPRASRMRRSARRFRIYAYFAAALALLCVMSEVLLALSPAWRGGDVKGAL